jgi:protease I
MEAEKTMATETLNGLNVAILVTDGFEQVEMTGPRKALVDAGAQTRLGSPKENRVKAWNFTEWGETFPVDVSLDHTRQGDFDALLLPGGVINPTACESCPRRSTS